MNRFVILVSLVACSSPPSPAVAPVIPIAPAAPVAPTTYRDPADQRLIARTVDTVDRDFGLVADDPYRWMETELDETQRWLLDQGSYGFKLFGALPDREALIARMTELQAGSSNVWDLSISGSTTVFMTQPAGAAIRKIGTLTNGKQRILFDPSAHFFGAATPTNMSLSPDGKRMAYVTADGNEIGEILVMDIATGKAIGRPIRRIWSETVPSWLPDGSGLVYRQMIEPRPGVDPMDGAVIKLHRFGTDADDDPVILGHEASSFPIPAVEWPNVTIDPNWVIASSQGILSECRVAIARRADLDTSGKQATPWTMVTAESDAVENWFVHGDRLYLVTFANAPNRKLVSVPLADPKLANARLEIAEDPEHDSSFFVARDAVYVIRESNGIAKLARWPWSGEPTAIEIPNAWIDDVATDARADGITARFATWSAPGRYLRYDPKRGTMLPIGLGGSTASAPDAIVADEVEVRTADGVMVPLSILHAKDVALDGSHPTILQAYGAYGISKHPEFDAQHIAWIERGGVIAIAHVRGGGEKGRTWQDDGSHEKKMNGVRDVIACAEYLIAQHYTTTARLVASGRSMGGVVVGRAMTERPDLFGVVHLAVGILDPLRIVHSFNGANQIGELGDPATEAGYRSIFAMDPYHHVSRGVAYPPTLFTVGLEDSRVAPWMSAKMAARMLASTTSANPIVMRVDFTGHDGSGDSDDRIAARADQWSFFLAHAK